MIGTVLDGRFKILELLSEDAAGLLWKGRHELLGRTVAIKVFKTDQAEGSQSLERFNREANVLCALDHPGIIKIYDSGMTPEREPYLVVELVEGRNLRELLEGDRTAGDSCPVELFSQVCAALSHAHQHGVLHGALKPESILVLDGDPLKIKLGDFGIAKLLGLDRAVSQKNTQTFERFGAVQYISPEQCTGRQTDARSDVYALGCVVYEYLFGSAPFTGGSPVEIVSKHISAVPMIPQTVSACFRSLGAIVLKALNKRPDDRFQSMKEFKAAFELHKETSAATCAKQQAGANLVIRLLDQRPGIAHFAVVLAVLAITAIGCIATYTEFGRMKAAECRLAFDTALSSDNQRWYDSATHLLALYENLGKYEAAAALEKRILPVLVERYGDGSQVVFQARMQIGEYLLRGHREQEARKWFDDLSKSLAAEADAASDSPQWPQLIYRFIEVHDRIPQKENFDLVTKLGELGELLCQRQQYEQCIPYLERSLKLRKELHGPVDGLWPRTLHRLGLAYWRVGRTREALEQLSESVRVAGSMVGFSEEDMLKCDMADFLRERGKLAEAEKYYKQSIEIQDADENPSLYAQTIAGLGDVYRREGRLGLAEENFRNARKIEKDITGNQRWSAQLHCYLAQKFMDSKDRKQANVEFKIALDSALYFNDKYQERLIRSLMMQNR